MKTSTAQLLLRSGNLRVTGNDLQEGPRYVAENHRVRPETVQCLSLIRIEECNLLRKLAFDRGHGDALEQ